MKGSHSKELFLGIVIHDALAAFSHLALNDQEIPIDEIAEAAFKQVYDELYNKSIENRTPEDEADDYAREQGSLIEGLVRGFHKHVWPKLMVQYEIVTCEQEMDYPLDGEGEFVFMTKPDLILRDKITGDLVYVEYKSTSSKKEGWVNSWETAVQLHSSVRATERALNETVSHVQIVGLYKGYESYGKQSSPFCYAYKKSGNPPFTLDQIQYAYKAGFKRTATWEMDGGVKKWVESMPDNILGDQFPMTLPIMVNDDLVKAFFRQRLIRETEIRGFFGNEDIDRIFPQRFDQCQPQFGWHCQYKKLCHGYVEDPLAEGFVLRDPHHEQERIQLGLPPKEE
jgi:hypothetical protein